MRTLLHAAAGLILGLALGFLLHPLLFLPYVHPVFSPEDGQEVLDFIDGARHSIDMEIYVLSSRDVVEALQRAKDRGVDVRIIIEEDVMGGENGEIFRELDSKGFRIRYASKAYKLTHSKFAIVDGEAVLVGSHNLSNSALFKNREASVIIRDAAVAGEFEEAFERDWGLAS